jgi:hypothetical protein
MSDAAHQVVAQRTRSIDLLRGIVMMLTWLSYL